MPRRIRLEPHLTDAELHDRYRRAADPVERSHWHFLWLLASGMTATAVAGVTGYSAYWIGHIARRYNTDGPDGMRDRRHALCAGRPDLPAAQLTELGAAVAGPHPEGGRWCGRTVASGWLSVLGGASAVNWAGTPCGGLARAGANRGRVMCRLTRRPKRRSRSTYVLCCGTWPR